MSLRDDCIHVLEWYCGHQADEALDAVLDVLTEHSDEWADYSPATDPVIVAHREIIALKLLAVLRGE